MARIRSPVIVACWTTVGAAACTAVPPDDSGGTCAGAGDCRPGGLCVDGVCVYPDGGGGGDGGAPDALGCDPEGCAAECLGAGFAGGWCDERGCQCTRGGDGGDAGADAPPPGELCGDGRDNDGDMLVDEECDCRAGTTQDCYTGDPAAAGVGLCAMGVQSCAASGEFGVWGECVGSVFPGAESCGNGLDDDCDGTADEGCECDPDDSRECYTGPAGTEGIGECRAGMQWCVSTAEGGTEWGECVGQTTPQPDACDGLDNDCDGVADRFCVCDPGEVRDCYDGPAGTRGVGDCYDGTQECVVEPGGLVSDWGPCTGWGGPAAEVCDGRDNDCDGVTDPSCYCDPGEVRGCYTGPASTRGIPPCHDGTQECESVGAGADWGPCTGEALPGTEACGNDVDDDCDGLVDEGCDCTTEPAGRPPSVTCPPDATTRALSTVRLVGTATDDCRVDSYRWDVVSRPPGSGAAPASPASATTDFTPDLVGEYRLRFTATDNEGLSSSCEVRVTATGQGLRVELFWDIAGDVDLHLLHPTADAWFTDPGDCYYMNCNSSVGDVLEWDAAGTADNPRLDLDDIPGDGPENINVDLPVTGHTYRVGVHHFTSSGCRSATVRIYCGDISLTPVATYVRSVCANGGSGNRDVWRVADVRWNGGGVCAVTELGSVISDTTSRTTR